MCMILDTEFVKYEIAFILKAEYGLQETIGI